MSEHLSEYFKAPEIRKSKAEIAKDIKDSLKANFTATELLKHKETEIDLSSVTNLMNINTNKNGNTEILIATIKAGNEFYFLSDVAMSEKTEKTRRGNDALVINGTILSKYIPGEHAEIVGLVDNNGLIVGRLHQDDLDSTVSRNHFSLQFDRGQLSISDLGSANGTVLFTPDNHKDQRYETVVNDKDAWTADPKDLEAFASSSMIEKRLDLTRTFEM